MDDRIYKEIEHVLRNQCGIKGTIRPESLIQDDLGLDSVGLMTLVATVEEKYDVNIDEMSDYPATLKDLVEALAKRQN